ncbi:MAG: hypothetical protein A3K19_04015 [Lentisphaerae bacterium RIFOXYB12_FULL_65_16]|nr:MAG: hypothetical protein A3K18_14185 [Lentisphaerae bacterium RIFOXYA12_64_32]OGV85245.1 MAG: hypothetical protein A3K19_04015 [Lentisphaerae bacterium RIFOXYB12_FULL_65_16]
MTMNGRPNPEWMMVVVVVVIMGAFVAPELIGGAYRRAFVKLAIMVGVIAVVAVVNWVRSRRDPPA